MMMPRLWGIASSVATGSEGAGAVSVAAALSGKAGKGKIACVVKGGNIDTDKLVTILNCNIPKIH